MIRFDMTGVHCLMSIHENHFGILDLLTNIENNLLFVGH